MAKRKVVIESIRVMCDTCNEPIATRGARANDVEHLAVTIPGGLEHTLDFCNLKCRGEWMDAHVASDAPTLAEQAPVRRGIIEGGHLTQIM